MADMGQFAQTVFFNKYAHINEDGTVETWEECASRVAKNVMKALGYRANSSETKIVTQLIAERKFVPGGRYLAAAGRPRHQTNNCICLRAEDSKEGWAELLKKVSLALMTGAGVGVNYSGVRASGKIIRGSGGISTGPIALSSMINEVSRGIRQGGDRRGALWAGISWDHPDVMKFVTAKDWPADIVALKAKDYNARAELDGTNVSVILDNTFFKVYNDSKHPQHSQAHGVYWNCIEHMLKTGEPGFAIVGDNGEDLRNACQPSVATVLTPEGIRTFADIDVGSTIWSGSRWTTVTKKWSTGHKQVSLYKTTRGIFLGTDSHNVVCAGNKIEARIADAIDSVVGPPCCGPFNLDPVSVMDGLLVGDGSIHKASNNLIILYIGEKDQSYFSSEIAPLIGAKRQALGPYAHEVLNRRIGWESLVRTYDREVPDIYYHGGWADMAGFLRGLFTANGSVAGNRITLKQTSYRMISQVRDMLSALGIASYVTTNKSKSIKWHNGEYRSKVSYDLNIAGKEDKERFYEIIGFIQPYKQVDFSRPGRRCSSLTSAVKERVELGEMEVFEITVAAEEHTYWTGGCLVSNCTEVTSDTDSDICNLGSVNLGRCTSLSDFAHTVEYATLFLLSGSVYSDLPYPEVDRVRIKNRRLGLGLMGIHEWLLKRGLPYAPCDELWQWLKEYQKSTEYAKKWCKEHDLTIPKATRAIAPNGTTAIVAETVGGLEPLFCVAYKRRYLKGDQVAYQYVVDPVARRLIEGGIAPGAIEDAYKLAENPERRVAFQAWLQQAVDQAISSTINLPAWGSSCNNESRVNAFGTMLMKYLPKLKGITVYPDGGRSSQPLTPCSYEEAIKREGQEIIEEQFDVCSLSGGSCGS